MSFVDELVWRQFRADVDGMTPSWFARDLMRFKA
jgi:hypothetical protein